MILFFLSIGIGVRAQTFAEWFRQKATQKKYLIEQIAALKLYAGVLKKGYDIGKDGLTFIGDVKNGDFKLHGSYFASLVNVNPEIKKYSRVKDIISLQLSIISLNNQTRKIIDDGGTGSQTERNYCRQVIERIIEDCGRGMDELFNVATDGQSNLKDDERLQRIDKLHKSMTDVYGFTKHFNGEVKLLIHSRKMERSEATNTKILYGIK
ncbi:hypothetical protein B0I18_107194 [Taibaiella chishuiensis]|uniref:TerB family tellurite resistance protein n=2 Tax=Taibaiella chishuiensis TaxID=1434707 RepID=A0A2P8D0M9_9BACT|nr:hypothetical protein B0I18_107194 [Taibaiella chishuiensis]